LLQSLTQICSSLNLKIFTLNVMCNAFQIRALIYLTQIRTPPGVANPVARKALKHVSISKVITTAVGAEGGVLVAEVERLQLDAVEQPKLQHLPPIMASQA